jgi:hypothetical protein
MRRDWRASQKVLESSAREGSCEWVRLTLHIDTPFLWIQSECLECSPLTQSLSFVDMFIATIISSSRIAFGVLVWRSVSRCLDTRAAHYKYLLCIMLPNASRTA